MAADKARNQPIGKRRPRGRGGFVPASAYLGDGLRRMGGQRGIAETRLLTQWPEVVGAEIARLARPIRITHGGTGLGGTMILLAKPGCGPELEMSGPVIVQKVNACCGYRAVTRIKVTQTAPSGFSEGAEAFSHAPATTRAGKASAPDPARLAAVGEDLKLVEDASLRVALENMARSVLSKSQHGNSVKKVDRNDES